jgi:cytochrome c biogenesis protein
LENQKGLVEIISDKIWKFFSSVKLAVVLLIILAIVSVIGTIIAQNESPARYLREYSQTTVNLFETLGFFDLYHTWWFILLLFLLTANLTVCTLDRFPHTWKIVTAPLKPIADEALKAVPFKKEVILKSSKDKAEGRTAQVLSQHRYRFIESRDGSQVQFIAQKGVFSRFGVYITHVSILLVFIGALTGAFFGFKGFLPLAENEHSDVVYLRNAPMWDKIMAALGVGKSPVTQNPQTGELLMPLGFYVQCDKFDVDYYQGPEGPTGMPSEYYSNLSVFNEDGQKIFDKRIRVNDPLTYHGITFYQSSYGMIPNAQGRVELKIRPKNGTSVGEDVILEPGRATYVPLIDRTLKATGFSPFGVRDPQTGQVMSYSTRNNEMVNPTVELEVYKGKGTTMVYKTYVMKSDLGRPYMPEDYEISYVHYWGVRYTELQVTKDPGVLIVYTGFIMLCIGPVIAFFGSHKKLWVRIQEHKGQAVITVAGSANRNRVGFERVFNRIVDEIAK